MTNTAHKLLDQLMDEEKKNLVEQQIDKLKTDILDMVFNKQEHFLQDRFVYARMWTNCFFVIFVVGTLSLHFSSPEKPFLKVHGQL